MCGGREGGAGKQESRFVVVGQTMLQVSSDQLVDKILSRTGKQFVV